MCLAVPMKLVALDGAMAGTAELDGARCPVNLSLLDEARVGDWVIVHAGFAIERLDEREAEARLALFEEMARAVREADGAEGAP